MGSTDVLIGTKISDDFFVNLPASAVKKKMRKFLIGNPTRSAHALIFCTSASDTSKLA